MGTVTVNVDSLSTPFSPSLALPAVSPKFPTQAVLSVAHGRSGLVFLPFPAPVSVPPPRVSSSKSIAGDRGEPVVQAVGLWLCDGPALGFRLGAKDSVGEKEGVADGPLLGESEGLALGFLLGDPEGTNDGCLDTLGLADVLRVGSELGFTEGLLLGRKVGLELGPTEGLALGPTLGDGDGKNDGW